MQSARDDGDPKVQTKAVRMKEVVVMAWHGMQSARGWTSEIETERAFGFKPRKA